MPDKSLNINFGTPQEMSLTLTPEAWDHLGIKKLGSIGIQEFLKACDKLTCIDNDNQQKLLHEVIGREDIELLRSLVKQGVDLNQRNPVSNFTPIEYALSKHHNYKMVNELYASGAALSEKVFKMNPSRVYGFSPLTLPKESAVTGEPLTWADRASLLLAGDIHQKFPTHELTIGFAKNLPQKIKEMVIAVGHEFSVHADLKFNYTDDLNKAHVRIGYTPLGKTVPGGPVMRSAYAFPLPPTTSDADLDGTAHSNIHQNYSDIVINSDIFSFEDGKLNDNNLFYTITHEMLHAIVGGMHPHDLTSISYTLALQPFIKNSVKVLDSQDLSILTYENFGKHVRLDWKNAEERLDFLMTHMEVLSKIGHSELRHAEMADKLKLVTREGPHLAYADTLITIEKYGVNKDKQNELVIHKLEEGLNSSFTLSNQGGVGVLDARNITHKAYFALDAGFCPNSLDKSVYYNGYMSPMKALLTGPGNAIIYLGHHDQWVEIQGQHKIFIWDARPQDKPFTTHIIGFRSDLDAILLLGMDKNMSFERLDIQKTASPNKVIKLSEVIDTQPEKLLELLQEDFSYSQNNNTIVIYNLDSETKSLEPIDFDFIAESHDPFTCAGVFSHLYARIEEIPAFLDV